jgi:membrane-associated phospholipid phosphatase
MKIGSIFCLATAFLFATSLYVRADVVTDWNSVTLNAIRNDKTPPPKASRALAILHVAIYDSVNAITRTHEPYLIGGIVPASASIEAAASAAAHKVLVNLFPAQQATFDTAYQAALASIPDSPQKRSGITWGESVAVRILAARATDGNNAAVVPPGGSGPGVWVPTPPAYAAYLLPQWAFLRPFCMASSAQVRPPGPPALTSANYAADLNEVKSLGAATNSTRTADQTEIALFWADGSGTETPPGHWNSIAQEVSAAQGNTLEENARLFALLNIAMADAAVCAWDAKYYFHFWRPVTAIRNADTDGNPDTDPDPNWSSFIITPPFPDYVSGHATFSGAAAAVLAAYYGTDNVAFTSSSDFLPGVHRSFNSFSAAAAEAALSRLYGGIHFRSANEDGLQSGLTIGQLAIEHFLLPKGNRSRIK